MSRARMLIFCVSVQLAAHDTKHELYGKWRLNESQKLFGDQNSTVVVAVVAKVQVDMVVGGSLACLLGTLDSLGVHMDPGFPCRSPARQ